MIRYACLALLVALVAALMAVIGWELVTRPARLWIVGLFVAGGLLGVALDRCRARCPPRGSESGTDERAARHAHDDTRRADARSATRSASRSTSTGGSDHGA